MTGFLYIFLYVPLQLHGGGRRSFRDSNSQPFDHESTALTNQLWIKLLITDSLTPSQTQTAISERKTSRQTRKLQVFVILYTVNSKDSQAKAGNCVSHYHRRQKVDTEFGGKKGSKWTDGVEVPACRRSIQGYILTYSALKREKL